MIADKAGIQIQTVILRRRIDIHIRMGGIVILIRMIVTQTSKHHTGLHVMTVNDGVVIREGTAVQLFHEDTAVVVSVALQVMGQIVFVSLAILDRLLDHGVGAVDIAYHIGIVCAQIAKIDIDGLGIRILGRRIGLISIGIVVRVTVARRYVIIIDLILSITCIGLLLEVTDNLHSGKHQHAQQDHQDHIVQRTALLSFSSPAASAIGLVSTALSPADALAAFGIFGISIIVHQTSLLVVLDIVTDFAPLCKLYRKFPFT